jgi:hypothetical protein
MTACYYPIKIEHESTKRYEYRFMDSIYLQYYIDKTKLEEIIKYILIESCNISVIGYNKHRDTYCIKKNKKYYCELHIELEIMKKEFEFSQIRITPLLGMNVNIRNFIIKLNESLLVYQRKNS